MKKDRLLLLLLLVLSFTNGRAQDTTTICQGDSLRLSTTILPGVSGVEWYKDGTLISNDSSLVVTEPGAYTLRSESAAGCTSDLSAPLVITRSGIRAFNDSTTTDPNVPVDISVLINDESPCFPMDTTTLAVVTPPGHGTVTTDGRGHFIYTPNVDFIGIDTFTYVIYDINGNVSNTALVLILVSDGGPLPIILSRFEAIKQGEQALLIWTTQHTENASHFEIERSGDAREFTRIGMVDAAENTNYSIDYRYIDKQPLIGRNYYRLRLVDNNGLYKYSEVRMLRFDGEGGIEVYPNPASTYITVNFGRSAGTIKEVAVVDMYGRILIRHQAGNAPAETIDIKSLAAAAYYVRLIGNDNTIKANFKISKTE